MASPFSGKIRNYQEALAVLKTSRDGCNKLLENNTRLILLWNKSIAVRHWSTNIVTYCQNGSMILDNGGYYSVSTKDRLCRYSVYSIWNERGTWYIDDQKGFKYYYKNGMKINPDGTFEGAAMVLLQALEEFFNKPVKNVNQAKEIVKTFTVDSIIKAWKTRYLKSYHKFIVEHCSENLLSLLMCTDEPDVREVIEKRFRKCA